MPTHKPPSRRAIIQQELAALDSPVAFDHFVERILRRWPSTSKNPRQTLRTALRLEHTGHDFVFLDGQMIAPLRIALQILFAEWLRCESGFFR